MDDEWFGQVMPYRGRDLAFVVPTKDRPHKIANLLDSLAAQSEPCGRVIIVDGGTSVRDVVMSFAHGLPVEHYVCQPPGQIRQRNIALSLLDDRTPIVGSLDDDIVLEAGAVAAIIRCWNEVEPETAGVGFNIVNEPREPRSWLRRQFFLCGDGPGQVLPSGMTTSNCQANVSYRSQWLCGGATTWRREILDAYRHREVSAKWAIAEDVIFSYPIGKTRPLYVCADAKVRHEHAADYVKDAARHRFHGRVQTLWQLYFVEQHPELSTAAFLWTVFGTVVARVVVGTLRFDRHHLRFAWGQVEAVARWALGRWSGRTTNSVIEAADRI